MGRPPLAPSRSSGPLAARPWLRRSQGRDVFERILVGGTGHVGSVVLPHQHDARIRRERLAPAPHLVRGHPAVGISGTKPSLSGPRTVISAVIPVLRPTVEDVE